MATEPATVINAAGKLTALGGSAQSERVASTQATWARRHVNLAELRQYAGRRIASYTGAEAACVTSGAAAGVTMAVAALVTGTNLHRIQQLPLSDRPHRVGIQAGHAVNYGATVTQLIRMAGAEPFIIGSANSVSTRLLTDTLRIERLTAFMYVQSHHSVQENMVGLKDCVDLCRKHAIPVIVDAAAEEDLTRYIDAGADLVAFSGGKAFSGPTSGFIAGRAEFIDACELQFQGIARTMKVGKEAIMGLLAALEDYTGTPEAERLATFEARNQALIERLASIGHITAELKADEAGRPFSRVAVRMSEEDKDIRELARFLAEGRPAIATRNHHLDQGIILIDPRELADEHVEVIADRLTAFRQTKK